MKSIEPKLKSTESSPDYREWVPSNIDNLFIELEHIINSCEGEDPLTLFRGQSNYEWPIDSTFVRNCIRNLFGIRDYRALPNSIRHQISFHRAIASLLLIKFGTIWKPSEEALEKEKSEDIDPWFELLKNMQQYPEKYSFIHFIDGSFLIDWSQSQDVALYFSIFTGKGSSRQISSTNGALWVYDAGSTGKILQVIKLGDILKLMVGKDFLNADKTFPLMFHPEKQTRQIRATNQYPIYIAQMDFRYDLADVWASYEMQKLKKVFVKLIIQDAIKRQLPNYLESKGITENIVYPE